MQMEDYLYLLLGGKEKQPTAMKDEEWEVLDIKALGTIRLCLDSSMAFNILKEKTSKVLILAHDLGTRNQNHQRIINKYS